VIERSDFDINLVIEPVVAGIDVSGRLARADTPVRSGTDCRTDVRWLPRSGPDRDSGTTGWRDGIAT